VAVNPFHQFICAFSSDQKAKLKASLRKGSGRRKANEAMLALTGIRQFFEADADWRAFTEAIAADRSAVAEEAAREYGDFQTPLTLAGTVCRRLRSLGCSPTVLIEPTCGRGNFIIAALEIFPSIRAIYALDIQERYVAECKANLLARLLDASSRKLDVQIVRGNVFDHTFPPEITGDVEQQVLILGNPPWVTNATLSQLNSANVPAKSNFKRHAGLDALTGKSNFDIAEFILLRLIARFAKTNTTLAMLCKNTVVRNLVRATRTQKFPIHDIRAFTFEAGKEFGVACDASLFVADLSEGKTEGTCTIAELEDGKRPTRTFGWVGNQFVADTAKYGKTCEIDGTSRFVWRQGIKHDCSKVMELDAEGGGFRNGLGEVVRVERDLVYPLIKSSDLKSPLVTSCRKAVIVTQSAIGEDTCRLRQSHPRLWKYLNEHAEAFAARKSVIYKDKTPFAIFGIGAYSFKRFKVATSGLYKSPSFSLVASIHGKPVMLDDTCYFLGFDALEPALVTLALLNSQFVRDFLESIVFLDSKRPYTKDVLMRIGLERVLERVSLSNIKTYLASIKAPPCEIDEQDFDFLRVKQGSEAQAMLALEKRARYVA
jgi:methylase of polypeptide subunit release factors